MRGEVRASGFGFDNPQKRLDDTIANPPIEQTGETIRIGKEMSRMRNVSIAYSIQVPRDTEVNATVASGAQTIRGVRGPVKVQAASGSIRAEKIERFAQLTTASGSISASDLGNDLRVFSASGSVTVSKVRGDVEVNAISGVIRISNPGGRVEADTASGNVDIQGAAHDVKAHAASGRVSVQGHPGGENYWELKTASGSVQLSVPASANLHLSAEAVSGEIRWFAMVDGVEIERGILRQQVELEPEQARNALHAAHLRQEQRVLAERRGESEMSMNLRERHRNPGLRALQSASGHGVLESAAAVARDVHRRERAVAGHP